MSFDPRRLHLTSWSEVCEHLDDSARWSRYRALLDDFGIDTAGVTLAAQRPPRFIFAEHPGNWAYPADVARVRLAQALARRCGTEAQILQFDNDVFRKNGLKAFFSKWCLHPLLPWVSLVRAKDTRSLKEKSAGTVGVHRRPRNQRNRAWHRKVYGSIKLQGASRQGLHDKLDMALELMATVEAGESPLALLNRRCSAAAREVIGGPWDRQAARRLAVSMASSDLRAAQGPLRVGLTALQQPAITWAGLWQQINSAFLQQEVGHIDPVFESFLLAIDDPWRMADRLAEIDGSDRVTVAGFVEDDEFRLVAFDRPRRVFLAFSSVGDSEGREIQWSTLREHAKAGRGSTPCAIIEYLMMAASGYFVVSDPYDGQTPFEQRVAELHQKAIGRRFPWVSLFNPYVGGHAGSYLDCYHGGLETFARQNIDRQFFDGDPP